MIKLFPFIAIAGALLAQQPETRGYTQNFNDTVQPLAGMPAKLQTGFHLYKSKCGSCHSLTRTNEKTDLSAAEWADIVFRMRAKASSHLNDTEAKAIVPTLVWLDQHREKSQ